MFTGTLRVEICEASGLRATDKQRKFWQDESPILDPYVQLDIDEKYLNRSSTKTKTFDPVWNETFTHEVQDAMLLGLTVFHNAALQPDDFVANCNIPFEELIQRDDETADLWVCNFFASYLCTAYHRWSKYLPYKLFANYCSSVVKCELLINHPFQYQSALSFQRFSFTLGCRLSSTKNIISYV